MTPEQWTLLIASVIGAFAALALWLPKYIARLADEKFIALEHKRNLEKLEAETEHQVERMEAETTLRESLVNSETLAQVVLMFSQTQTRHADLDERRAKLDERRTEQDERRIEADNRLATAIDNQTKATTQSREWTERRFEDTLASIDLINKDIGDSKRTVERIEASLKEAKAKLDDILINHVSLAQQGTLIDVQKLLVNLTSLVEGLVPKPSKQPTEPITAADLDALEQSLSPLSLDDTLTVSDEPGNTRPIPELLEDADNNTAAPPAA